MEKRKGERFKVQNGWKATINQKDEFSIKDISIRGVCLECTSSLIPNNPCTIEIDCGENKKIVAKAKVIRSFLKRLYEDVRGTLPLYHTGVEFVEMNDHEKIALRELINNSAVTQEL
jgi:hypothetical protein